MTAHMIVPERRRQRFAAMVLIAVLAMVTANAAGTANAQDSGIKLSVGADYSTGEYGTGKDVDIFSVPVTASFETGRWNLGLTVPYIRITSEGDVVGGTGAPVVTKKKKTATGGTVDRTTESGLGDIVASAGYALNMGGDGLPFVELVGKVKFPTASASKSLGTGEFDYTVQLDFSQAFGRITPFATLGYRISGDPDGVELDNIFIASAGAGVTLGDRLGAGLAVDYRQATTSTADDALEISPYVSWSLTDSAALNIYGVLGLSDGSPDSSGGLQLSVKF